MKALNQINKGIFVLITLLGCVKTNSQNLIESRQTSYYTYIYKLNNEEAKKIYQKSSLEVDQSNFHTLVESYPTDSAYTIELPQGHYLKTFADKNKQKVFLTTIQNFNVYILNNNTDLCVQVYDLKGNIIDNADVNVRWKKLRFNDKTQSYIDRKSNQKGLLQVTHNGFTAYYNLNRSYNNSQIKRGVRMLVYGTPIKYTWLPVDFVISVPIDIVKSAVHFGPQGTVWRTFHFFEKSFGKIACLFDDWYCRYHRYDFERKHKGYLVFNKPKYQPGDTVKFKAFIVSEKGNPINRTVDVYLQTNKKDVVLTKLEPYRKGAYEYEFLIHDSLNLILDRPYEISLRLNKNKSFISKSFKYEDYELSKNELSIRTDGKNQYTSKPFKLYVKGTDENNLNLLDGKIEALIKPLSVKKYLNKNVFVPDTLLFLKRNLDSEFETEILIPDSIFPEANLDYDIRVKLLTSDNEMLSKSVIATYFREHKEFSIDLINDSIEFKYLENGIEKTTEAEIIATDNFDNKTQVYKGVIPCALELIPYYSSYRILSGDISYSIDMSSQPSLLHCFSERTKDSVYLAIDNPRKIHFSYNLYKKNNPKKEGYADSLLINKSSHSKQNYFLSIRYLWGGEIKEENYKVPYNDKKLNVSVSQPKLVYPGQKAHIEVSVQDVNGNPVKNVDVTAYSLTSKFKYSAPNLPSLGKHRGNKAVINNFRLNNRNLNNYTGLDLDYYTWKVLAGIDSIEYYKFLYPKQSIYKYEYVTVDSTTQFSPFIVSNGEIKPIHVVYIDGIPVYFSWSTHNQPYSFKLSTGWHVIKLRTSDKIITIDDLYFNKGKKLIFSLDESIIDSRVFIDDTKPTLSDREQRILYRYIFPYRNDFHNEFAYITNGEQIQLLNPSENRNQSRGYAGPVVGNLVFHKMGNYSTEFYHEPFFEYDFSPNLLKMRSVNVENDYPKYLRSYEKEMPFTDVVLTKDSINNQRKRYLDFIRRNSIRYDNPKITTWGLGKLLFHITDTGASKKIPLNVLLFNQNDDLLRIYPGSATEIHGLIKGPYKLVFFYPGGKYCIQDSIYIKPNGINYYEFDQSEISKKDSYSEQIGELIKENIYSPLILWEEEQIVLNNIKNKPYYYANETDIVEGYVFDQSGVGLPGVTVIAKGSTAGTVTDLDGYYSLNVPFGYNTLSFSYIGYYPEERNIGYYNIVDVVLKESVEALEEVVVIGYGVSRKSDLTAAISSVSANELSARPVSSVEQALQGRAAGTYVGPALNITIRGIGSMMAENKPLYIIDGKIFTGDFSQLNPESFENIEVIKDPAGTAIYGARGANGVIIIKTKGGVFSSTNTMNTKGAEYTLEFLEQASKANSIRDNFSDYAFWFPKLTTDKNGKASFDVTYPDDVTSWDTYILAMNGKKQSGQTNDRVKSYKPLMAQLAAPRFFVETDTAFAIGKTLNYTPDSIKITTQFEENKTVRFSKTEYCSNSIIDSLQVIAKSDTMELKYTLKQDNGYFDGELRKIPVFPLGLEEVKGDFAVLDNDSTIEPSFDKELGNVTIYAKTNEIDVIEDEITHLINYRYLCNEQLASKLKALLAKQIITEFKGDKFKYAQDVEKIIRLLNKNKLHEGIWGWWKNSPKSYWITLHALEALTQAQKSGYSIRLDRERVAEELLWDLESGLGTTNTIRILKILKRLSYTTDYKKYIDRLDSLNVSLFNYQLQIIELKQMCGLDYNIDTLYHYQQKTRFGNVYFSSEKNKKDFLENEVQNTLLAYRILRNDSSTNPETLKKIRNYFFENRNASSWGNTYESAEIIETILPDLLANNIKLEKPVLEIVGDTNLIITEFPFEMQLKPDKKIKILNRSVLPIYLTYYQKYWNAKPIEKQEDFEINTSFSNNKGQYLKAGEKVKLIAKVKVNENADYVMVNIPVPGGCSYGEKNINYYKEVYREYYKHETAIFCQRLSKGEHTFEIELIPRYSGVYNLNPAKIELMYYPTFSGNNEIKKVRIGNYKR